MASDALAWLRNGLLALLAVAIGLAACEAALRLFHPRYELAANPVGEDVGGTYRLVRHPDTGTAHRLIYNNLGGRQSRDFPPETLDTTVNVAVFGDSQTANVLMPAQYSFTEPLDFLLNVGAQGGDEGGTKVATLAEPRFSVLGFGTSNYGPARSYLRWRGLSARGKFAHVLYMVVHNDRNDLRNAFRFGHVRLGESGEVLPGGPFPTPTWKRVLGRLHLTYLTIDAWQRLALDRPADDFGRRPSGLADKSELSRDKAMLVFRDLLLRWNREVQEEGGVFHLVLLPNPPGGFGTGLSGAWLRGLRDDSALRAEIGFFDLTACFDATIPDFAYGDWRFDNDPHWSPAGTMVAATCLYRYLEGALGLPEHTDADLAHARHAYYQAFLDSHAWEGQRYTPDAAWARAPAKAVLAVPPGEAIVARYLALELAPPIAGQSLDAVRAARLAGALAKSAWEVYANTKQGLLVFVKSPCSPNWRARDAVAGRFLLLHAVPFTPEKLPAHRARSGFVNLDDAQLTYVRRSDAECVFFAELPDYPLSQVRLGQFTRLGDSGEYAHHHLWSVEFRMPLARSVWDVYASEDERGLYYVKDSCAPADTQAHFFLHVYPLRDADLPADTAGGYANLDFGWAGQDAGAGATDEPVGRTPDGGCRISVALPDYPIAFVRTGQFRSGLIGGKRLWSTRIDFAEAERVSASGDDA